MNQTGILGFDVGGTKTTVLLGAPTGEIFARRQFPTPTGEAYERSRDLMLTEARLLIAEALAAGLPAPAVGSVSIGGPLDIQRGIIYSPPHLPTWQAAPLKEDLERGLNLPVFVEHDGNAGALAEYYFGAGRGARLLIFLTLGTGLGAGIIVQGQVLYGVSDMAGEVGHVRIAPDGPVEYGKAGSWEGYCSGAGLRKLAAARFPHRWSAEDATQTIVRAALDGDADARAVVREMGEWLGKGIGMLVDILNPDVVVVGTLGVVLGDLLLAPARSAMLTEALAPLGAACRIEPALLGPSLGDTAALVAGIRWLRANAPE